MADFSRASWRLKLQRAKKHLEELDAEVAAYLSRHPYGVRRQGHGNRKRHVWRYVLRVTEQPNPEIAVILGDVVHNIRSALDHLAVAIAPPDRRSQAGFPIVDPNVWTKDTTSGRWVAKNPKEGERFVSLTKGMPPDAVAIIDGLQPCDPSPAGNIHLRLIGRLENADKHRGLVPILGGLNYPDTMMFVRGLNRPGISGDSVS